MLNTGFKKCVVGLSGLVVAAASPALLAAECDKDSGDITVAVASNFYQPGQDVAVEFQKKNPGVSVRICHDATGILKGEITSGNARKYDVFLAADNTTPAALKAEQNGNLVIGDEFSYAQGEPVLWSKTVDVSDGLPESKTPEDARIKLVIAEPDEPSFAPYGIAAKQILTALNQWPYPNIETKSNISLTYDAVNVNDDTQVMGFVAKSQVCLNGQIGGYHHEYPAALYTPIIQDGIVINRAGRSEELTNAAKAFAQALQSDSAIKQDIIKTKYCYVLP